MYKKVALSLLTFSVAESTIDTSLVWDSVVLG